MYQKIILLLLILFATSAFAQKHVLVLHSYDMSYMWTESLHGGIMKGLRGLPADYDIHVEYMDTRRNKGEEYFRKLAHWYGEKYKGISFDIVLTADDDAFNFFIKNYKNLYPHAALFFCGKGTFDESLLRTHPNPIRGVMEFIDMLDNLHLAGRIHHTKKAYYIVDASTTGQVQFDKWMKVFHEKAPQYDVTPLHLTEYSHEEIIEKVKTLTEGVILMNVVGEDRLGHVEDNLIMTRKIADVSQLPIYVESSMRVGFGTVGGKVVDGNTHGLRISEKLVSYVLGGDNGEIIDQTDSNIFVFDYNGMKMFNIDADDLPFGSIILNRPESFYEQYKTLVWSAGVLLLIFISIIAILMMRIFNRREFQKKLENLVDQRTGELNTQIEEQKRLRKTLISKEKLASLGNLTAGIAHEIKNPLNIIINSAQIIETRSKLFEDQNIKPLVDIRRMTELIIRNSFRADSIIQNMLGQVRNKEAVVSLSDLNQLVEESLSLVYHASTMKYQMNVSIKKELSPDLLPFLLSKESILRALINLIENSFYALNKKSISSPEFIPEIQVSTLRQFGNAVLIIKDNGTGIPTEVIDKIFEPFFTTKPAGDGTGLGLSMVNDIITSHGGEIEIETRAQEFTSIRISIPIQL